MSSFPFHHTHTVHTRTHTQPFLAKGLLPSLSSSAASWRKRHIWKAPVGRRAESDLGHPCPPLSLAKGELACLSYCAIAITNTRNRQRILSVVQTLVSDTPLSFVPHHLATSHCISSTIHCADILSLNHFASSTSSKRHLLVQVIGTVHSLAAALRPTHRIKASKADKGSVFPTSPIHSDHLILINCNRHSSSHCPYHPHIVQSSTCNLNHTILSLADPKRSLLNLLTVHDHQSPHKLVVLVNILLSPAMSPIRILSRVSLPPTSLGLVHRLSGLLIVPTLHEDQGGRWTR